MKMILKPMLFVFFITLTCLSCNNEELFIEPTVEDVIPDDTTIDDDVTDEDTESGDQNTSLPCDFDLSTVQAGDTVIINCMMDLDGQTVNLPSNVTIVYEGGDIINGTLNFSDTSVISGELLNTSLTLGGTTPQLKDPVFNFDPKRWGIVEGEVPQDVALQNTVILNDMLTKVKSLGAYTFKLDKLDAYFYGDKIWRGGIEIPSDMTFEMTNNTHLRQFLTASFRSLIFIKDKENITVSGGFLHGNRNLPGFDGTVSGGNLIVVKTGVNITFDNIHMSLSPNDGINIESTLHASDANYIPSRNILIKGCTFDSNRRNNLSLTDGIDMIIENCTFLKAGIDMENSKGKAPRFGVDFEPHKPYQNLESVIFRNNIESGSVAGGIVFADGTNYTIEGNTFESGVYIVAASHINIRNNNLKSVRVGEVDDIYSAGRVEAIEISGNNIRNGSVGIQARTQDLHIFDNNIINCGVGIQINSLTDSHIYNNTIESNGVQDDGINALFYVNNVLIENNSIKVNDFPFYFDHVNHLTGYENNSFTIKNNVIDSKVVAFFSSNKGLRFIDNTSNTGVRLTNSKNTLLDGNTIKASKPFSIELSGSDTNNLKIMNNIIENDDTAGQGNGIIGAISSGDNKNIEISSNQFSTKGYNSGIRLDGFHGITVKNNTGYVELRPLIRYTGNNSTFTNNSTLGDNNPENDISGSNNSIN